MAERSYTTFTAQFGFHRFDARDPDPGFLFALFCFLALIAFQVFSSTPSSACGDNSDGLHH
ncbi:MAG: hypothetical protein MZV70_17560 [Desulfobacterales bacterium]|nr:hypothetical protein [Desulfobacterales bacterium]